MQNFLLEFKHKLDNILLEAKNISSNGVVDAIENKYRVIINYDDETDKHQTGPRLIEPYVFGLTNAGNQVIRAFQYYGATRRGVPKYKLFRLDRIISWNPQPNNHFYVEPKKLAKTQVDYNENGDNSMGMVFAQVEFNNNNKVSPQIKSNTQEWESPLDRIKRERNNTQHSIEAQLNNKININKQGAVKTKALTKELDKEKGDFKQDINKALGIEQDVDNTNRGAVAINTDTYDKDNKSQEEKHNDNVLRRRDDRWQKAADTRPLWRKNSINSELQQNEE